MEKLLVSVTVTLQLASEPPTSSSRETEESKVEEIGRQVVEVKWWFDDLMI